MSKVKICGLSRPEDICAVNAAMPDYIGFVFAPSRRRIDLNAALTLRDTLDPKIEAVGVFVNEDIEIVADIYAQGCIDLVQLHGGEGEEYIDRLKGICGCRIIKSVGVGGALPPLPAAGPDYLIFDVLTERHGGIGVSFNWDVLKGYGGIPYFLAGGLTAENVSGVVKTLSPYCVDVSSGVEAGGVKDADKIMRFVKAARL